MKQIQPEKTQEKIKLTDAVEMLVDYSTGKHYLRIDGVNAENSVMGVPINHIFAKGKKHTYLNYKMGKGFMLNVTEKFLHNQSTSMYTDENFIDHTFTEQFYYLDGNNKAYLTVDKSQIVIEPNGKLTYDGHEVFLETPSDISVKYVGEMTNYKGINGYESRSEEFKEKEEKIKQYEHVLTQYVVFDTGSGDIELDADNILDSTERFETFYQKAKSSSYLVVQKQDALNVKSLYIEKNKVADEMNKAASNNDTTKYDSLSKEYNNLNDQIQYVKEQETSILNQFLNYYKEYCLLKQEYDKLVVNNPVRYIVDGDIVKGFNQSGLMVLVADKDENYVAIDYDKVSKSGYPYCVARLYDNKENQVQFEYDKNDKLICITDKFGKKTNYTYDGDYLKTISYADGNKLTLDYDALDNISAITDEKTGIKTEFVFADDVLIGVKKHTLLSEIGYANTVNGESEISSINFSYNKNAETSEITMATIETESQKSRITLVQGKITQKIVEKDGLIQSAEQYEYVPYWTNTTANENPRKVTKYADDSILNVPYTEDFTFVEKYRDTIQINQFELPESRTVTEREFSEYTSGNGAVKRQVSSTTSYVYDKTQTLIEEITSTTYTNPSETTTLRKKYFYDARGELVKTESFVPSEVESNGKTIKEYVYDDNGNQIKSFSYNSLDPTSKYYTESVLDENGKVTGEVDCTGKHKTEYIYDKKGDVIGEKLANGSTLCCDYDESGETVAITQSTEDGTENSTKKYYTNGELTKVESGDTTLEYTYDEKRRVKSVKLNGENNYLQFAYDETTGTNGRKYDKVTVTNAKGEIYENHSAKLDGKDSHARVGDDYVTWSYDDKRRLTSVSQIMMDIPPRESNYTYNDLDQVTSYTELEHGIEIANEVFTYNANGQLSFRSIRPKDSAYFQTHSYTYTDDSTKMLSCVSSLGLTIYPKYDTLKRNKGKKAICGGTPLFDEQISYVKNGDHATILPSSVKRMRYSQYDGSLSSYSTTKYEYDNMGNIVKILVDNKLAVRYQYDVLGRIVREDNKDLNKTYLFYYDNNGNITTKKEYAYTLKDNEDLEELDYTVKEYVYDRDKLVRYDGTAIVYDETLCPTTYKGKTLTWQNGRLKSYDNNTFIYDTLGKRVKKNDYNCYYDSEGRLVKYRDMQFIYDETGIAGYQELGATYAFVKDAQGNVIELLTPTGYVIARYIYDAWGNCKVVDTNGQEITSDSNEAVRNPIRYRGYFYDVETGLYFLKSRYYDPETGRFISPDAIEYADPETINGLNLYAYCGNNPVMNVDPDGHFFLLFIIGAAIAATASIVTQKVTTKKVDWTKVLISAFFGGISGVVGGTGISLGLQYVVQGALGVAETLTTSIYSGEKISGMDIALSFATSGFFGMVGAKSSISPAAVPLYKALGNSTVTALMDFFENIGNYITPILVNLIIWKSQNSNKNKQKRLTNKALSLLNE